MGYAVYEDRDARDHGVERWAGYAVPAVCDEPSCSAEIDRGVAYKCETRCEDDENGNEVDVEGACGLYFCGEHLRWSCPPGHDTLTPKPDTLEWVLWMISDESWGEWRSEFPAKVAALLARPDVLEHNGNAEVKIEGS